MSKQLFSEATSRAVQNFPISGWPMPTEFLTSLALIKEHAARTNGALKLIPIGISRAIASAALSIKKGKHLDQFPVDIFQTGSGTSSNMNMNEVIASLASKKKGEVHPNDHVNKCQSSNDVIPTAMQISCALAVRDQLLPAVELLGNILLLKAEEFSGIIKTGRTHCMDAVPVCLGDEFRSFAILLLQSADSLEIAMEKLCVLPLGGTAVGTGLNAHGQFAKKTIASLKSETKLPLSEAADHIAAQSCPLVAKELSSALCTLSIALTKMGNDIRLMASGPTAGFGEIVLPSLQPGSSIMPGKVNPVLCESIEQVSLWVMAGDSLVTHAVASGSRFELNTCYPLLASSLLTSVSLLANVMNLFGKKCVKGIKAQKKHITSTVERNAMLVTVLASEIGYDAAATIAKEAMKTGKSIVEVAERKTGIPRKRLEKMLDPKKMI